MSDMITTIEASMRADADALRIIGQNIANAEVIAYRRQIPIRAAAFDQMVGAVALDAAGVQASGPDKAAVADTGAGTLKATGEPLHLAIEGSGFFALDSAAGALFTRRGDFHVSADGILTAASGNAVLGVNGPVHLGTATPTIDADGTVRIGSEVVDRLQVLHFADQSKLQYVGNGLYASHEEAGMDDGSSSLRQGFVETSNVTPVAEMVQLMETMRHFEAAQRLVRGYDQILDKAINELGKTR